MVEVLLVCMELLGYVYGVTGTEIIYILREFTSCFADVNSYKSFSKYLSSLQLQMLKALELVGFHINFLHHMTQSWACFTEINQGISSSYNVWQRQSLTTANRHC